LVGREESGLDSDQVSSPATLRVKWQEEKEGLQLVCGEVSWTWFENGAGPESRILGQGDMVKEASR
jgi:hypothetical protein